MDDTTENMKEVFYRKEITYSLTYNPGDKYQYFGDPDRFKRVRQHLYETFISLGQQDITYKFCMELSEPREIKPGQYGPRYHLHGWFKFNTHHSIHHFLEHTLYKWSREAYVDIDICNNILKWEEYMRKQQCIFSKNHKTVFSNWTTVDGAQV